MEKTKRKRKRKVKGEEDEKKKEKKSGEVGKRRRKTEKKKKSSGRRRRQKRKIKNGEADPRKMEEKHTTNPIPKKKWGKRIKSRSEHVKNPLHSMGLRLEDLYISVCTHPHIRVWHLCAWSEDLILSATTMRIPPKPFLEIPHYYHENVSMERLCKLHGWGNREY
ncbi:hypothetical protein Pint_33283 [Pistacia integerrima]|uniref:Uncharacterized protein n=1 Tax=Pistacia integerrima TaxID=434235 RepID=A0ACC0X491_9ROSI|nr:hypothetical protein Pint_33283 [Pistacia integerrima]